jgi:hypothetical protein
MLQKTSGSSGKARRNSLFGSTKPIENAICDDDARIERTQFPRKLRNATEISFGKSLGKEVVRPFDETLLLQALPERYSSFFNDRVIRF